MTKLSDNWRAQMTLAALRKRPHTTIELQEKFPLVHVARQIWELRHWYDFKVKTRRLESGVALYELVEG